MTTGGVSARSWWAVFASALALVMGNGPVMQFTFGVFIDPLAREFATRRDTLSAALTIGLCLTGVCMPLAGRLVDRYGARTVTLPAIALLALSLMATAFAASVTQFFAIFALMGVFAAGQTPLPYSRAIAARFDRRRGLALGIAMAGVGLGTALVPKLTGLAVAGFGWRHAYFGLGLATLLIACPAAYFALGHKNAARSAATPVAVPGLTTAQALGTRALWFLAASFFLSTLCASGLLAHVVPLLADHGIPARLGVMAISVAGVSLIIGRIASGFLVDRLPPATVAAFFFAGQATGITLLLVGATSLPLAMISCCLVGLGLGAEVDLLGYILSRLFGLKAFGTLYGLLFGIFMLANGIGPLIMGKAFTSFGTYRAALAFYDLALLGAIGLILALGPALRQAKDSDFRS